ncbi:MAG: HAD family hydrolase [Oligoflexus sp.]
MKKPKQLIVLDIDNTVFDWVSYYVTAMESLLIQVAGIIGSESANLAAEAKQVFEKQGSIEYPFLIQELPAVMNFYQDDIDRMLREAVEPGRQAFIQAAQHLLRPYDGVNDTLQRIRHDWPDAPIVALTDAPRYVAMWKLNKLGLLSHFQAVYGLPDPKLPTHAKTKQVKVDQEILIKHLERQDFHFPGRIRTLPDDYEKPGPKGLRTVFMDFEMEDDLDQVLWVGDNLRKDVGLGRRLGVHTAWAEYGTRIPAGFKDRLLAFSPDTNVHKNVALDPKSADAPVPDVTLQSFDELLLSLDQVFSRD